MKSKITAIKNNLYAFKRNHCYPRSNGQGVIDYVVLLTIIIVVLLIMGYYIRNSLSGKMREGADVFGRGETYLPLVDGHTEVTVDTVINQ